MTPISAATLTKSSTGRQGEKSALAEGKSGQEVDGNDRDPDPLREPAEQTQHEEDGPEFDEQDGDVRARGLRCRHDLHLESAVRCSVRRIGCSVKDVRDLIDRGLRAHGHDKITGQQHEVRCRRRQRRTLAEHRHDGRARTRTSLGIAKRPASIGRVSRHWQLLDDQSLGLALKHSKSKCQRWSTQYLCDRVRLVCGQRYGRGRAVPPPRRRRSGPAGRFAGSRRRYGGHHEGRSPDTHRSRAIPG